MSSMGTGLRCFVASLAILSLAGHLSAVPLAAGVSCQNNNPFIKIMKDQGVELYSQPKQVTHVCQSEFSVYGSCCNEFRLRQYAAKDKSEIKETHGRLIVEFRKIVKITSKLIQDLQNAAATPVPAGATSGQKGIIAAQINAAVSLQTSIIFQRLVTSFGATTEIDIRRFATQNYDCWMKLADERSASICATCSGRSDHFFLNGKILISKAKCEELSRVCADPMAVITKLITGVDALSHIFKQIADAGIQTTMSGSSTGRSNPDVSSAFEGVGQYSELLMTRQSTARAGIAGTGSSQSESLCNKFVRMREPVMLEDMERILGKVADVKFKVDSRLDNYIKNYRRTGRPTSSSPQEQAATNTPSKWSIGQRLLQFNGSPPALGSDATFVDPTDPSYTSVGVSGHGPLPETLTFP